MIKQLLILLTIAILASCSSKQDRFRGAHKFSIMTEYYIQDTTTIVDTWNGRGCKEILINKVTPLKIDIFQNGEELKGTYTVTRYQEIKNLKRINRIHEGKSDIHNLHIVNDTLLGEIHHGKKIIELKLSKNDSNVYLTIRASIKEVETEECNKLATISNNHVTYKSLRGTSDESEQEKQSNDCAVEKSITICLESSYKADKSDYLRKLLTIDPRK
jgi:hypothetical protein